MAEYETIKLLVGGEFSVGKTEFIRSVSEIDVVTTDDSISSSSKSVSGDKEPFNIAMDFGRLTADNPKVILYLFGNPGARRATTILQLIEDHDHRFRPAGVIIVAHSARCSGDTGELLQFLRDLNYPFVIALNWWDAPNAVPLAKFKRIMGIRDDERVLNCNAINPAEVIDTLLALFEMLPDNNAKQHMIAKLKDMQANPTKPTPSKKRQPLMPTPAAYNSFNIHIFGQSAPLNTVFIQQVSEFDPLAGEETYDRTLIEANEQMRSYSGELLAEPIPYMFGRLISDPQTALYFFTDLDLDIFPSLDSTSAPSFLYPPEENGFVVLVDANEIDSLTDTKRIVTDLRTRQYPFVVAVNNATPRGTLNRVKAALDLRDTEPFLACDVTDRADVCKTLIALLSLMPETDFKARIIEDVNAIRQGVRGPRE